MPFRRVTLIAAFLLAGARAVQAQDSQFGIRGGGTPGRPESVRARSTGGAFAAFDAASAVADVSIAEARVLTATTMGASYFRQVTLPNATTDLTSTRFPLLTLVGAASSRVRIAGGYSTYLEDSYVITTLDSAVVRGDMVRFIDQSASDGGSSDLRISTAVRVTPTFTLGVGLHAITGSARISMTRTFFNPDYATVQDSQTVRQSGFGVSASALFRMSPALTIVAFGRADGHTKKKIDEVRVADTDLPNMVGGAVRLILGPLVRAAGSVAWREWTSVNAPDTYNTLNYTAGLELGSEGNGLRIGGRYGQLPFGPGGSAPTEWGVAAGFGRVIARGHAVLDFGAERVVREGTTLHEGIWTLLFGLSIRQ